MALQQASMDRKSQHKANLRLALILASVAALFAFGFVLKTLWLGRG